MTLVLVWRLFIKTDSTEVPTNRQRDPNEEEIKEISEGRLIVVACDEDEEAFYFDPNYEDTETGHWRECPAMYN